jgi:hypothetical protein
MANHKWRNEIEHEYGTKPQICVKCGVGRRWHGGDYQAWEYYWYTNNGKTLKGDDLLKYNRSWKRPECGEIQSVSG